MLLRIVQIGSKLSMEAFYKSDIRPPILPCVENVPYCNDDLEEHMLDVIYPKIKKSSYPFIINIHGGAFSMYSKDKLYRNYAMRLARNEFAVVNINYRLAPNSTYPAQVEDVLSAIKFIADNTQNFNLDKNNMFLCGDSAGAYLAAMAACALNDDELKERYNFNTDIVCRAIALNSGMYDFTTLMDKEVTFPMKIKIVELLFAMRHFEGSPHFPFSSVFKYVNEKFPPAYLTDTVIDSFAKEALRFEEILKKKQPDYKLHIFDEKDNLKHAFNIFGKYPQSNMVLNETFEFFKNHKYEAENI